MDAVAEPPTPRAARNDALSGTANAVPSTVDASLRSDDDPARFNRTLTMEVGDESAHPERQEAHPMRVFSGLRQAEGASVL
jgi:hypothetical protein